MTELEQMKAMFDRVGLEYSCYNGNYYDDKLPAIDGKYQSRPAIILQIGDADDNWSFWFETTGELIG
jgi:hypothetical protein